MCNAHGEVNRLICPHETYSRPDLSEGVRQQAYASLFDVVYTNEIQVIRNAVDFQCQQEVVDSSIKLNRR